VAAVHAVLHVGGYALVVPGRRVIAVEAQFEVFEPLELPVPIVGCSLRGDGRLDDGIAVAFEVGFQGSLPILSLGAVCVGHFG